MADTRPEGGPAILMVTRRFWPHTDDSVGRLTVLAEGLRCGGAVPTLLAARYSASWPSELVFREVPMLRPVAAPRGDWSGGLYVRGLVRWLRENAPRYDVLYADNMREEGAAVVEAAGRVSRCCIVRCDGTGEGSDTRWASTSRAARRTFNQAVRADAVIAPVASAARELIACGANPDRVHRIDDGVPAGPRRDAGLIAAARASLASVNGDLHVPTGGRVILCTSPLTSTSGVMDVAEAIVPLCRQWPELRVWLIGDGPAREPLHRFLVDHAIRDAAALPGCFGHVDELLRAADMFVVPSDADSLSQRLPAALGTGLPTIVPNTPETRALLGPAASGVPMFTAGDAADLQRVMWEALENYPAMLLQAEEVRRTLRHFSPRENSVAAHLNLINHLIGRAGSIDIDHSTGAAS